MTMLLAAPLFAVLNVSPISQVVAYFLDDRMIFRLMESAIQAVACMRPSLSRTRTITSSE